jgi:hypothetical protein
MLPQPSYDAPRNRWILIAGTFLIGALGGIAALKLQAAGGITSLLPKSTGSQAAAVSTASDAETLRAAALQQELAVTRAELKQLRAAGSQPLETTSNTSASPAVSAPLAARSASAPSTGQITLSYWNALNSIIAHEAEMRVTPPQLTVANAGSFVSGRTQAFEYAASAIRKLHAAGVDADVVALAQDLAQWYDEGIANSRQAESLLQSSDIASRQGAPGQLWQTAERQHRDRCLEINQHGAQLQQSLSRKYGVTFPALE